MKVSVAIIAKNSAQTIVRTIESVRPIAHDIVVVVDSSTSDNTQDICKREHVKIKIRKFDNFASQKNYATSQTQTDWVLSLDADEWLTDELISEIRSLTPKEDECAYAIYRKNIIFNKVINHTNWDPNGLVRLFNKQKCTWKGDVHEQVICPQPASQLHNYFLHENYVSVEQFLTKQDIYSTLEANQMYAQGQKFHLLSCLFQPLWEFCRRYFLHLGFLDGWHGFFLSYLMSIYHLSVWIKLWQKSPNQS